MRAFRFLIGYFIGFFLFIVVIPYLLVVGSRDPGFLFHLTITSNPVVRLVIAIPVFCTGLLFAAWSNLALLLTGRGGPTDVFNVAISPRSKKLVVTGPYRYSRNPMVFGALSIYCSIAVFLDSLSDLMVILACIPFFILYLKLTEEKRLLKDFGNDFLEYRSKVPMIIPFTKIRKRH
jgi:protein-S-isoprenylcysteine O-methyltransferase Ste14